MKSDSGEAPVLLTVIIPAYNESDTINSVLERLLALDISMEVILVDDASTDDTVQKANRFPGRVRVLRQEENRGKGMAIRRALPEARGEVIAIQDADLEYYPEDLPQLLEPFQAGAQVVYGVRFQNGRPPGMRLANYLANMILAAAASLLFPGRVSDEATCYKLFKRDILTGANLQCRRFEFCPEITAKVMRSRLKIVEVPVRYSPRTVEEGKKITWRDGFQALWTLLKYRFVP